LRILIADDDPVSLRILHARLTQWGYQVVTCTDGNDALRALQAADAPHLAILDWMMPSRNGVDVCRDVRALAQEDYIYIILLTARDRKEDLLAALEAGADDYLTKPYDPAELKARLRTGRRIMDLQAELITARDALHIKATHDPLTGLWNRGAIEEIVNRELARSRREGQALSVGLADLDRFKGINDTYGHAGGDAVLREATKRLQQQLRIYDSLGRYGGEEFLVVLPGCDAEMAPVVGERLRSSISENPFMLREGPLHVTLSLGVATIRGGQAAELIGASDDTAGTQEVLVRTADLALYRAKQEGRNRVVSSTVKMAADLLSGMDESVPG
jgi:diguanylate cyclase (GGDEF)-like protein